MPPGRPLKTTSYPLIHSLVIPATSTTSSAMENRASLLCVWGAANGTRTLGTVTVSIGEKKTYRASLLCVLGKMVTKPIVCLRNGYFKYEARTPIIV